MSSVMSSRAAVFNSEPQDVEVYQAGTWWDGKLLGWRHAADGSCQVQVRATLGGVEATAWMELGDLRLPERDRTGASEPVVVGRTSSALKLPQPSCVTRRAHLGAAAPSAATASTAVMRDRTAAPSAPRSGGRRRAPDAPGTVTAVEAPRVGGRRRAADGPDVVAATISAVPRSGGRRRAPEGGHAVEPAAHPVAGRHRAAPSVGSGRHRKADTGLIPTVVEPTGGARSAAPRQPVHRLDDTVGGRAGVGRVISTGMSEPEVLTRPMRLSDEIPHARRPRLDGSLTTG